MICQQKGRERLYFQLEMKQIGAMLYVRKYEPLGLSSYSEFSCQRAADITILNATPKEKERLKAAGYNGRFAD